MSDFLARPSDVHPDWPLRRVAAVYSEHVLRLRHYHHGIGQSAALPPHRVIGHAITALAAGTELVDRVSTLRWSLAVDALGHGATHEETAAAMGIDIAQLRIGIGEWADGLLRERLMTPERHADVLALLIGEVPE